MKKLICLFLATLFLLCGCQVTTQPKVMAETEFYDIVLINDTPYLNLKRYVRFAMLISYASESFNSLAELKDSFLNGSTGASHSHYIKEMYIPIESGSNMYHMVNIYNLCEPVLPEGCNDTVNKIYLASGIDLSFRMDQVEVNVLYNEKRYNAMKDKAVPYDRVTSTEPAERNSTAHYWTDNKNKECKALVYQIQGVDGERTVVENFHVGEEAPYLTKIYGISQGQYFEVTIGNDGQRHDIQWLAAFGLKKYVE